MQQGKNNIISEINRIHQILGINKKTSDVVLEAIGGGILDELASAIVSYAAKKGLDKTSRNLVRQLQSGNKRIIDASGKVETVPLTNDEMTSIFARLRNSSDEGLRKIVARYDDVIGQMIEQKSIPNLLKNPDFLQQVKGSIEDGFSEDETVDYLAQIPKQSYGVYADDTMMDAFTDGVRKIYREMTGKVPDDVVDDTGKVVDDTGKVVDDVTGDGVSNNIDEMIDGSQPPTTQQVEEAFDNLTDAGNNSREIAEVSPLFNRYQNQAAVEGVELANEAMTLIERFAESRTLVGADRTALARQIKALMDRINNWDKTYAEALEDEINNNLNFPDSPNYKRWLKIRSDVDYIRRKFGKWGVREITTNLSPTWIFIKETFRSAFRLYVDIYDLIKSAKTPKQFAKETIDYVARAFGKAPKIDDELKKVTDNFVDDAKDNVSMVSKYVLPGSPRGWPTRLNQNGEIDLPNSYGPIQRTARSNQYAKAWLSLFAEKILIVLRVQLEYSVLMGMLKFLQFIVSDNSIMRDHGDCVLEFAAKIREGNIKINEPENFKEENLPPCFVELISSEKLTEEQLGDFMVRAEFFSRGSGSEITGYFTPYLFDAAYTDIGRFFVGSLGGILIKGLGDWYDWYIEYEKTGNIIPLENELRKYSQKLKKQLEDNTAAADQAMKNLNKSEKDSLVLLVDSLQNASGGTDFVINTDD